MAQVSDAKEKLLNSALNLIYARSYADVGVQELCEHAGVKKGSFYHFFPSKRDLTIAALDRQWEIARRTVWEPAFSMHLSSLKRIERCFDLFYEHQCGMKARTGQVRGCPFGNLALELSTQDEAIRRKVDRIFREVAAYLERALRDAVAAGEIPDQDVGTTAQALVAYMEGVLLLAKTRNDPELIKRLRHGLVRYVTAGRAWPPKGGGRKRSRQR